MHLISRASHLLLALLLLLERSVHGAAASFEDAEGHAHQARHWQFASDCASLDDEPVDIWRQKRNEYQGDEGLVWSDWSAPAECS